MKPGEIVYDFSKLEQSEEFKQFLGWSLKNKPDIVDIEKCKEGMDKFIQSFVKPIKRPQALSC